MSLTFSINFKHLGLYFTSPIVSKSLSTISPWNLKTLLLFISVGLGSNGILASLFNCKSLE